MKVHVSVEPIRRRLKHVLELCRERAEGQKDGLPYVGLENIQSRTGRFLSDVAEGEDVTSGSPSDSLGNAFKAGDVLFGKLRPYLAKAWVAEFEGRCSTEFLVLRPRGLDSTFLKYICLSDEFLSAVNSSTFGSRMPRADWDFIGSVPVPVPPPETQRRVGDYLDRETGRIDELVAAKERLIELIGEKRRALITHAVTRGLDAKAPMRDSGVPWLGQIPAHWKVAPVRFVTGSLGGGTPDKGNSDYWIGDIPWVSPKDMKRDEIGDAEDHVNEDAINHSALKRIPVGSILIVVRGMILAHSFPVAITTDVVTINQDMRALQCGSGLLPEFLQIVFRGFAKVLVSFTDESAHGTKKLDSDVLGKFDIPVPDTEEQRAIVAYVRAGVGRLDTIRAATERTMTLLKERRAALIAAAVTGQIEISVSA